VFHHDHFSALQPRWLDSSHALGLSYFHGRPGTSGYPEFDNAYETLKRHASRIDRVQVTHAEMHELVLEAGVGPDRVHRIPIGVDLEKFPLVDEARRKRAREELAIPQSAFVIGSFVKDGVGLGDGNEPSESRPDPRFVLRGCEKSGLLSSSPAPHGCHAARARECGIAIGVCCSAPL
jgi:hypothetical protein